MFNPPHSLQSLIDTRIKWLQIHNYAVQTLSSEKKLLYKFGQWCHQRAIEKPQEVTLATLEAYQHWLSQQKTKAGNPLSLNYQRESLARVRLCFQWAYKQGFLLLDPTVSLRLPRKVKPLPAQVLSLAELEAILGVPDTETTLGLRDRALLEVLYSTAIRLGELLNLKVSDLDRGRELLWIRQGKGKKDRMVPISKRAIDWVDRYEQDSRSLLLYRRRRCDSLFIGRYGKPLGKIGCNLRVTGYIRQVAPEKKGSCHLIRHSVATILMERGCHVRYIQELLGHQHLSSTQVYTKVAIPHLKAVYQRCHPSSK